MHLQDLHSVVYIEAIKGHSEKSVLEYASDLRTFFRYIVKLKGILHVLHV